MTLPAHAGTRPSDIFDCFGGPGQRGIIARTLEQRDKLAAQTPRRPMPASNPNAHIPQRELGPTHSGGSSKRRGGR